MNADDLQQLMDRELNELPTPQAPDTLLPRVLAATVARKPAPWYARPWLAWPHGWQIASAAVLVAIGVGLSMLMAAVERAPGAVEPPVFGPVAAPAAGTGPGSIRALVDAVEGGATLMRVLWQVLLEPAAFWILGLAVSLSLACAAVWSALERGAMGGASHQ